MTTNLDYETLYPEIDTLEIQPSFTFNQDENESDSLFFQAEPFQASSFKIESMEIEPEIPIQPEIPIGEIIPSIEAVNWKDKGYSQVDIRPRLVDSSSGEARLLDSGAQLSAAMKGPEDKVDNAVRLVAVNGSRIPTYGTKELVIKMGRQTYRIQAVICDVKQDILGFDFITKYKLGLEWDDFDQTELFVVDKRAKIKAPVKIVTVPISITRAHHLESVAPMVSLSEPSNSTVSSTEVSSSKVSSPEVSARSSSRAANTLFEVACMKSLGEENHETRLPMESEQALKIHDPEYADMVKAHPELLKTSFQKGKPVHKVWHKIETSDHPPCKAKRRPVLANKEKDRMGRETWEKMIEDGIIEEVKPGSNTDWSSALHLADKPGGGVRPCPDFRVLNTKTVTDAHPLPLLKDFTKKIHGSVLFSKVDLRSAFFNDLARPQTQDIDLVTMGRILCLQQIAIRAGLRTELLAEGPGMGIEGHPQHVHLSR